jgi:hypothetical protein
MTELEHFEKVWNNYQPFIGQRGDITKRQYEEIIFSIWANHDLWDDDHKYLNQGFQINCFNNSTMYRAVKLALDAGLLIKVANYSVGRFTRFYQKNYNLFNLIFRSEGSKYNYNDWLNDRKKKDFVLEKSLEVFNDRDKQLHDPPKSEIFELSKTKVNSLCYDLSKLYDLSKTFRPYYYDLLMRLNDAAVDDRLKFKQGFIHWGKDGLPSGRPFSSLCISLNPEKEHKTLKGVLRPDFFKSCGIPDYEQVYDIKSEFPRVNYLFHTGEWKDDSYDFYQEIIDNSGVNFDNGDILSRGGSKYVDYNDSMKQLFMRFYFGKPYDKRSWRSGYISDRLKREKITKEKKVEKYKIGNQEYDFVIDRYSDFFKSLDKGEDLNFDVWIRLVKSTDEVAGPSLGTLVMWYSFFIETEVKIELLKRGKVVYNVYDGFYYNEDIKNEIIDLLKVKSKFVFENFMKPVRL